MDLLAKIDRPVPSAAPPAGRPGVPGSTPTPELETAMRDLDLARSGLKDLRDAALSLDAKFTEDDPAGWAKRYGDDVKGLERSEARLEKSVAEIAALKDPFGRPIVAEGPPPREVRAAADARTVESWTSRVKAAVERMINEAKTSAAKLKAGRQEWVSDARQLAEIVEFVPALPPGIDAEFDTPAAGPWRTGLIDRVREKAATLEAKPVDSAAKRGEATAHYTEGVRLYDAGLYAEAEKRFAAAASLLPYDARFRYFRALALRSRGRFDEAAAAARRGYALERRSSSDESVAIDDALIRVQYEPRLWLESYRETGHPPTESSLVSRGS